MHSSRGSAPAEHSALGEVSTYAASLDLREQSPDLTAQAKRLLADSCGTAMAGRHSSLTAIVTSSFAKVASGPATVVGFGPGWAPGDAAMANAASIHESGIDDIHGPSRTHPAAAMVPAVLAAAEVQRTTGYDLLAGLVVGYDITARLSLAMGVQPPFDRGFHPGTVCGTVGAAVAAARVLRLPVEQLPACIALASSQASGLMAWENDPSHTLKSAQLGAAARSGVTAALLASGGFLGAPDVFEGPHSMLHAFSPYVDLAALVDALGQRFEIMSATFKRHAGCAQIHTAVDALLTLTGENAIGPGEIDRIDVELARDAAALVDNKPLLTHNAQYVLALAAIEGAVLPAHFAEPWVSSVAIKDLSTRVYLTGNETLQSRFPAHQGAIVTITARGQRFRVEASDPEGSAAKPLSESAFWGKYDRLTSAQPATAAAVWAQIAQLDEADDVSALFALLGRSD